MGELICVCRYASLVVCVHCQFSKDYHPDKAWNHPGWDTKDQGQGESQSGLDALADEILANMDPDEIECLGLHAPTIEEEK